MQKENKNISIKEKPDSGFNESVLLDPFNEIKDDLDSQTMENDKPEKEERKEGPNLDATGFLPANELIFSWQAKEFIKYEKDKKWFLISGFILLLIVLLAIFVVKNYLMAITFILAAVIYFLFNSKEPRTVNFSIYHSGIEADGNFYTFDSLDSFWIFYNNPPNDAYLSVRKKGRFSPYIQMPIGTTDPSIIREILLNYLKEEKHKEDITNIVEKMFKF